MLPYPGQYESYNSWDNRCKEWESDRRAWQRQQAARSTNWGGYNYCPVLNNVANYKLEDGRVVFAVKVCRGSAQADRARTFAIKHGLCFVKEVLGKGITARTDGVAFKPTEKMLVTLNDDTPRQNPK